MTTEPASPNPIVEQIASLTEDMRRYYLDQVTRYNRLYKKRESLLDQIARDSSRAELTQALLDHPDPDVQMTGAWQCGWDQFMVDEAERTVLDLAKRQDEIGRSAASWLESRSRMPWEKPSVQSRAAKTLPYFPAPKGYTREAAVALIKARFPGDRGEAFVALLKPSIHLWPVKASADPDASCFGGLPRLPRGTTWPISEDEPLLFLGQINCAELHAAVGKTVLPEAGLLQFYGHPDDLNGGFPVGGGAVIHFADDGELKPAAEPIEDFTVLPRCGLKIFATMDLPDLKSRTINALGLNSGEVKIYSQLRSEIGNVDEQAGVADYASKMFGWPDVIQEDWWGEPSDDELSLMQIGDYHDGSEWHCWGPGGIVYFTISSDNLATHRFEEAEMTVQCT